MQIKDLKPNVNNPRKMSEQSRENLSISLRKFGDLSCIIENKTTGNLVSGHQRVKELGDTSKIKITQKYENPTATGTIAVGYVESGGEQFKFRRVVWDKKKETEALLAANKHSGQWDEEILQLNFTDFPDMDLNSIGFDEFELEDLGIELPELDFTETGFSDDPNETDAQYMKKNTGPSEYEGKERLPNTMLKRLPDEDTTPAEIIDIDPNEEDPFKQKTESTDVVGKRHVIIIDVSSDEVKKSLREKIRPFIEEVDGKIF